MSRVSRYLVLIALAVLVTARVTAVSPSPRYRMIDLGALIGEGHSSAQAINDRGQDVGSRSPLPECETDDPCPSTAVIFENGTVIDLVTPTGLEGMSTAMGINNRGQSVGYVHTYPPSKDGEWRALRWERGSVTALGMLTGSPTWGSYASGINDRGQIVGTSGVQIYGHAVLWQDGDTIDLGALPADSWSEATAINERGQIVGWSESPLRAVLWDHGAIADLGTLGGPGGWSQAFDINDRGQIVGNSGSLGTDTAHGHGVLWEEGTITDLGTLTGPAGWSYAAGVNNRVQIVGYSSSVAGTPHAVLWERGTITDLGTLTGDEGYSVATAINSRGQIVGYSSSVAGTSHAVLWEPETRQRRGRANAW